MTGINVCVCVLSMHSEVRLVEILDGVCRHSDYDVSLIIMLMNVAVNHVTHLSFASVTGYWRTTKSTWKCGGSNCKLAINLSLETVDGLVYTSYMVLS